MGSEKKNDPLKMSVTYPVLDKNNPIIIKERNMHTDTFVSVTNKKMHDWFKVIKTSDIKDVDTLISVIITMALTAIAH